MDNSQPSIEEQPINTQKGTSHSQILSLIIVGIIMLLLGIGAGYLLFANKNSPSPNNMKSAIPTKSATSNNTPSPTRNSVGSLEVSCSEKYNCIVSFKDEKTNKLLQREIDLSQLGWDVALVGQNSYGSKSNLIYYNPESEQLIIPLTVAPGGIAGNKPEGTLPEPPFISAIYSTTFTPKAPLKQLYVNNDFQPTQSLYVPQLNQLLLAEIIDTNNLSKEIIWSFNFDSKALQKFTEVSFPALSMSGSIFMALQLSDDKIVQRVEPNGGNATSKAKIVTIDINTKKVQTENTSWH